jgi:SAM-dependent methyltransferase
MSVLGPAQALETDAREFERVARAVAGHLPPSLVPVFTPGIARSQLLCDEYVHRLTVRVFADSGLAGAVSEWGSVEEIIARAGLDPGPSLVPADWMLRQLAARGVLDRADGAAGTRFRLAHDLPSLDPAAVLDEQRRHDPACLPSYVVAETAARDYPAFLQGKGSGDEILLAPARLPLWVAYFSNDNALYAVNNRVGAAALEAWTPRGASTVLELGGGLASGATAVLERLAAVGRLSEMREYRFTELVPVFLRRGQRLLQERFPDATFLAFAPLDMNRPFAEQDVAPESMSTVYAVNTLHVAYDLAFTLGEVRRALAPGGQLIVCECVRLFPGQTMYPEFVFNLMGAFRAPRLHTDYRPNGGFLTVEQWTSAIEAAGFCGVRVLPDVAQIRNVFPTFFVAAIGATRGA